MPFELRRSGETAGPEIDLRGKLYKDDPLKGDKKTPLADLIRGVHINRMLGRIVSCRELVDQTRTNIGMFRYDSKGYYKPKEASIS